MSEGSTVVDGEGGLCIRVHMDLRRRSGRRQIILPEGPLRPRGKQPRAASPLVLAVVRAHRWKELLESGRYASIDALAARMGVDSSYVGRHLDLTLLAPDIVEAIITGHEPDGLSLEKLRRLRALEWGEQRRALGMG